MRTWLRRVQDVLDRAPGPEVDRHIEQACADQKRLNWNSSRPRSARRTRMKKPRQEAGLGRSMGLPGMRKMANHRHHITVGCTPQGRPRRKSPAGAGLSPMRAAEKGGGNAAHTDTIPQPVAQRAGDSRGSVPVPQPNPATGQQAQAAHSQAATPLQPQRLIALKRRRSHCSAASR